MARLSDDKAARRDLYLTTEQSFQLRRGLGAGSVVFGKPRVMTGAQALELNRALEQKFLDSKDPKARLWRWVMPDPLTEDQQPLRKRTMRSIASINADIVMKEEDVS